MKKFILLSLLCCGGWGTSFSQPANPGALIQGTWHGVLPDGIVWVFTDSTVTFEGKLEYSYSLVTGTAKTQCQSNSYDAVYDSNQLVLIELHPGKTNTCYIVDMLTESRLVLFNELNGRYLSFKK